MKNHILFHTLLLILLTVIFSCGSSIEDGYTDQFSYYPNDHLSLFINGKSIENDYEIDIENINGDVVGTFKADIKPQKPSNHKPYQNGFGYKPTRDLTVPNLESGIYLFDGEIPFLVKSKKKCDIIILYSSNTENAYAFSGGKSTYSFNSTDKIPAEKVSFHRPIELPFHSTEFLKWVTSLTDYSVGYICDKDLENYEVIRDAKLLIIPGHSEYWTRNARLNFDRFIDSGKNALILSGNTMWWQVRYSKNFSQLIAYKSADKDSLVENKLKTVNWSDTILNYPIMNSIGVDFTWGGYGKEKDNGWDGFKITNIQSPILEGVDLKLNDIISLPTEEYDGANLIFSSDSSHVELKNDYNFHKYELIGYDLGSRSPRSNGAWIVLQKTPESGIIINTSSTNWCRKEGMEDSDSDLIKRITLNMIDLLLNHDKTKVFSSTEE